MDAKEFVGNFYLEKERFLEEYFSKMQETEVGLLINSLKLNDNQHDILKKIMETSLTGVFYSILLGLDGAASIGNEQQLYEIKDEEGNQLSGGEIEAYAYHFFYEKEDI